MSKKNKSCLSILVTITLGMVIFAILVSIGFYIAYNKLNEFFNRGGTVVVPDFRGKHITKVIELKPDGLEISYKDKKFDLVQPRDHVIAQYPEPGTVVKPGKQVLLTVSLGVQRVKVPDLLGKSVREVDVDLLNAQLVEGSRAYVFSSSVAPDRVVAQSPMPGEEYGLHKPVNLLISLGMKSEKIPLPNFINLSFEAAKAGLKAWGLKLGRVLSVKDTRFQKFRVVSTDPAPYSYMKRGDTVNILISAGFDQGSALESDLAAFDIHGNDRYMPKITMAGFRALRKAQAIDGNGNIDQEATDYNNGLNGGVLAPTNAVQTPLENLSENSEAVVLPAASASYDVTSGSSDNSIATESLTFNDDAAYVNILKKKEPAFADTYTSLGSSEKEISYMMPDGFMPKELKIEHVKHGLREIIYSGTHKPLEVVKVKVPIVPNSKLQIYINDVPVEELKLD